MFANSKSLYLLICLLSLFSSVQSVEKVDGLEEDTVEDNWTKVQRLQNELREIFSNEKPYDSGVLKEQMQEALNDVLSETNLNNLMVRKREFTVPQMRMYSNSPFSVPSNNELESGYLNDWVVHLEGGKEMAETVLRGLGYKFHGQVTGFKDLYRASHESHPRIHKRAAVELTQTLKDHHQVVWAEQQLSKIRAKRGYDNNGGRHNELQLKTLSNKKRNDHFKPASDNVSSVEAKLEKLLKDGGDLSDVFNDKMVSHQWYLYDTRVMQNLPKLDLGVAQAWAKGYTGKGVRVNVLDDGLEYTHDELKRNYDPKISHDFNDDDDDPIPRTAPGIINSHGTKCAGEIAMEANNGNCGVGIAHNARIGAIRMLDGHISDRIESESLSFGRDNGVDIVVCSWGPSDDGKTVEGPNKLAETALSKGVDEGRDGKGTVFVWASGNGGLTLDNCNCDGYASSVYTISVNSASSKSKLPWYGEECASTMTSTYSSGAYADQNIITSDIQNQCTPSFTGTSAAAPLAAGVLALALEANPKLTWRDVQHLTVCSSNYDTLSDNEGWQQNALGYYVNLRFGFGLLNAEEAVKQAEKWELVSKRVTCTIPLSDKSGSLSSQNRVKVSFTVTRCLEGTLRGVFLEHVEARVTLSHSQRGSLHISLISPRGSPVCSLPVDDVTSILGTNTTLLTPRPKDVSTEGFDDWPLMSVHTWGEDPEGAWDLYLSDTSPSGNSGEVTSASLVLHTAEKVPTYAKTRYEKQYSFSKNVSV